VIDNEDTTNIDMYHTRIESIHKAHDEDWNDPNYFESIQSKSERFYDRIQESLISWIDSNVIRFKITWNDSPQVKDFGWYDSSKNDSIQMCKKPVLTTEIKILGTQANQKKEESHNMMKHNIARCFNKV